MAYGNRTSTADNSSSRGVCNFNTDGPGSDIADRVGVEPRNKGGVTER